MVCCGRGRPRKRIDVFKGDPPILHFSRGQRSDLLTLAQKYDTVCPAISDDIRDTSPYEADPVVEDDGEL